MHPARSIIVFTTLSGAGYGLLFWLAIGAVLGWFPRDPGLGAAGFIIAGAAVSGGLLSSLLHLGRPERAWRAVSQWRSSWLSREGVASVATYVPAALFAGRWATRGGFVGLWLLAPLLAAAGAAATVVSTAYIYRSLKPVAQWSTAWVPVNFLTLAAMTGALWLAAIAAASDATDRTAFGLAIVLILLAAAAKLGYWRAIDRRPTIATAESATGLGAIGRVRLFEAPHTSENYLLKEMGFRIARKHAGKLRRIALGLGFLLPLLLILGGSAEAGPVRAGLAAAAALAATAGVLVERWLFFAEAKHTVTLYYGAARV